MNQPAVSLPATDQNLDALAVDIRAIHADNQKIGRCTVVNIAGGSSTGKSTQIAEGLRARLEPDAQIVSQDNFQLGRDYDLTTDPVYRWDGLGNYGLPESAALLASLRHGLSADMPVYSFSDGRRTGQQTIFSAPIILFEGLYAGFGALRSASDLLVYVEAPLYARLLRRLFRNTHERYRADPAVSFHSTITGGVLPAHRDLVRQQRATADVILQTPYAFPDTMARFGLPLITRTYAVDTVPFSFRFGTGTDWRIEADPASGLHMVLLQDEAPYASFPIDQLVLEQLELLDLTAC